MLLKNEGAILPLERRPQAHRGDRRLRGQGRARGRRLVAGLSSRRQRRARPQADGLAGPDHVLPVVAAARHPGAGAAGRRWNSPAARIAGRGRSWPRRATWRWCSSRSGTASPSIRRSRFENDQDALVSAVASANPRTVVVHRDRRRDVHAVDRQGRRACCRPGIRAPRRRGHRQRARSAASIRPASCPSAFPKDESQFARKELAGEGRAGQEDRRRQLRRRRDGRLQVVRRAQAAAAVPVRLRALVHALRVQRNLRRASTGRTWW